MGRHPRPGDPPRRWPRWSARTCPSSPLGRRPHGPPAVASGSRRCRLPWGRRPASWPSPATASRRRPSSRRSTGCSRAAATRANGPPRPPSGWRAGSAAGLPAAELVRRAAELRDANDLWAALVALRPDVAQSRASLESRSGRPWLLSGSGPTLFALYASLTEAREAVQELGSGPAGRRDGVQLIAAGLGATHRRPIDTGGTA